MSNDPKNLVNEWAEQIDEDLGALITPFALAGGMLALRGISGMHGPATDNQFKSQAGPIGRSQNEFASNYPASYTLGEHIKHMIIGKSGNDREQEILDAEEAHRQALAKGDPKAIEINGHDPLESVRGKLTISPDKKHVHDYVKAVLAHARATENVYAEPEDEDDFDDYYDVEHAAAAHLSREGVIPKDGSPVDAAHHYYLERVRLADNGEHLEATYAENHRHGIRIKKQIHV